jgi:rhodanese-related sulfurtransferase
MMWEGNYANPSVPDACKKMFVTSVGQIQPMQLQPDIETYGEMEVMKFIKEMQYRDDMLLIDTRMEEWYHYRTIPGAINISHFDIAKGDLFPKEFQKALQTLGVTLKNRKYDFLKARTILLFCNGAWCGQSPEMIKHLLKLGYPPKKIKWYRGGMHDWLTLSMTSTRGK